MVPANRTVIGLEDPVRTVTELPVPSDVLLITLQQYVTGIQKPAGSQHPAQFADQLTLPRIGPPGTRPSTLP